MEPSAATRAARGLTRRDLEQARGLRGVPRRNQGCAGPPTPRRSSRGRFAPTSATAARGLTRRDSVPPLHLPRANLGNHGSAGPHTPRRLFCVTDQGCAGTSTPRRIQEKERATKAARGLTRRDNCRPIPCTESRLRGAFNVATGSGPEQPVSLPGATKAARGLRRRDRRTASASRDRCTATKAAWGLRRRDLTNENLIHGNSCATKFESSILSNVCNQGCVGPSTPRPPEHPGLHGPGQRATKAARGLRRRDWNANQGCAGPPTPRHQDANTITERQRGSLLRRDDCPVLPAEAARGLSTPRPVVHGDAVDRLHCNQGCAVPHTPRWSWCLSPRLRGASTPRQAECGGRFSTTSRGTKGCAGPHTPRRELSAANDCLRLYRQPRLRGAFNVATRRRILSLMISARCWHQGCAGPFHCRDHVEVYSPSQGCAGPPTPRCRIGVESQPRARTHGYARPSNVATSRCLRVSSGFSGEPRLRGACDAATTWLRRLPWPLDCATQGCAGPSTPRYAQASGIRLRGAISDAATIVRPIPWQKSEATRGLRRRERHPTSRSRIRLIAKAARSLYTPRLMAQNVPIPRATKAARGLLRRDRGTVPIATSLGQPKAARGLLRRELGSSLWGRQCRNQRAARAATIDHGFTVSRRGVAPKAEAVR